MLLKDFILFERMRSGVHTAICFERSDAVVKPSDMLRKQRYIPFRVRRGESRFGRTRGDGCTELRHLREESVNLRE
jgi:hypothetical protein